MNSQRILFAGCSFTADCGFNEDNRHKYHWPYLLEQHYNAKQTNIAIGGCSNDEIFLRSLEASVTDRYDLAIIMWSELGRKWIYSNNKNIDDFTIINNCTVKGNDATQKQAFDYAKLHYAYFDNQYVNLKKWLLQCIALANFFKNQNQPYVFALGFSNLIDSFKKITYSNGFVDLDDVCKDILDFDNRPDDYIWKKVKVLQDLITQTSQLDWFNFDGKNFYDSAVDVADDQEHPGMLSNQKLYQQLVTYIDQRKLL
jgi:hypothetical protein